MAGTSKTNVVKPATPSKWKIEPPQPSSITERVAPWGEVWHGNFAPVFPWGETIFHSTIMSLQMSYDLSLGEYFKYPQFSPVAKGVFG